MPSSITIKTVLWAEMYILDAENTVMQLLFLVNVYKMSLETYVLLPVDLV